MDTSNHIWQFSKIGGVSRVNLESGEDLLALEDLDQKLWTALSSPVHGLEIDPNTLTLVDIDKDGKIRVPEILEAVKWITSLIKDPNDLVRQNDALPLSAINDDTPLGKSLLASSKQILANIGKPDATAITVEETSDTVAIFAATKFNGDGIVTEDSTDDDELKTLIGQIVQSEGSVTDRSGKEGISTEQLDLFYTHCEEYSNWHALAENDQATILPFGEKTEEAFLSFSALKSKIEDYFLRCQLAEFDPVSADTLNSLITRVESINSKDLSTCIDEIANFPIAKIEAQKPLSLTTGINPAWKEELLKFRELVFPSKNELDEKDWKELSGKFDSYNNWKSQQTGAQVEPLGLDIVREIMSQNKKDDLITLIEEDKKLEEEANNIILVEKLVRYYRDLFTLLKNFVTFSDFYSPNSQAIFQTGSLFFDQRSCDLCIKVSDMAKHNSMAGSSGICLVYLDCYSKVKDEKMTIVAALTDGDVDNLVVGRNAIFYDKKGLDWDATIIKIIDNPISIRQAFWSPYRKVSKFISKQIEKFASAKDQEIHTVATSHVEKSTAKASSAITESVKSPGVAVAEQPKPAPFDIAKFAGIFAAIGLAFGAIGSVLASVVGGFLALTWWKIPLAFIGIILAISGPSMILAWLKLRKRNLAPVLDANGWAINAKATINIAFGATLTHLAKLPKNSKQNYIDPFKEKKNPWIIIFMILVLLAGAIYLLWHFGFLERWNII
jgi:hypothetical protein